MDKRFITFLLLSFLVFQITMIYMERNRPQPPVTEQAEPAGPTAGPLAPPPTMGAADPMQPVAPPPAEPLEPVETVALETDSYALEFSPRGAVPVRWDVIDPEFVLRDPAAGADAERPHEALIDPEVSRNPNLVQPFQVILRESGPGGLFYAEFNRMIYQVEPVSRDGMRGLRFVSPPTATGLRLVKTWLLPREGFMGRFEVELVNEGSQTLSFATPLGGLGIVMGPGIGRPFEAEGYMVRVGSTDVVLNGASRFYYEHLGSAGEEQSYADIPLRWGGIQGMYFIGVLIPAGEAVFQGARAVLDRQLLDTVASSGQLSHYPRAELYHPPFVIEPGQTVRYDHEFYIGPKHRERLMATGHGLERTMFHDSYGWFRPIIMALKWMLDKFQNLTGSWGIAIILLTIMVRILAFPLVHKGMKAQAKMMEEQRRIKPLMDKVNEKYKNDPQRKQQEIFKLYREHNINPFGMFKGCIWLFIQIPIFVALYKLLLQDIDLRGEPFLWFSDLSQPDRLFYLGVSLPLLGSYFNLLPLITAITQMLSSKFMQTSMPTDPQQAQIQKMMIYFMPFFILVLTYRFPAGLMQYWLVSNIWQVLQQLWVNKHMRKPEAATAAGSGPAPRPRK